MSYHPPYAYHPGIAHPRPERPPPITGRSYPITITTHLARLPHGQLLPNRCGQLHASYASRYPHHYRSGTRQGYLYRQALRVNYQPRDLYPGRTDIKQEQINRPAPTYASGPKLNEIAQRYNQIQAQISYMDPLLSDFINIDVPRLLTIARAAYALQNAHNAESYRQALGQISAALK
jgi:hypothetical protein